MFAKNLRYLCSDRLLSSADSESVGDAIYIIKPRCDQGDLQNGSVIEPDVAQPLDNTGMDLRCVLCQLNHIITHRTLGFSYRSRLVIVAQCCDQIVIQGYETQKLCVRFHSVETVV